MNKPPTGTGTAIINQMQWSKIMRIFIFNILLVTIASLQVKADTTAAGQTTAANICTNNCYKITENSNITNAQTLGDQLKEQPLNLTATFYYTPIIEPRSDGINILTNSNGNGPFVSEKEFCDAAMEGSVTFKKSNGEIKSYSYGGRGQQKLADCSKFYPKYKDAERLGYAKFIDCPFPNGCGAKNNPLIPFRTVAVNKSHGFKIGTVIFIPEAVGQKVPQLDGTTAEHDGYFLVGDYGDMPLNEIDVFVGAGPISSPPKSPFRFTNSSRNSKKPFGAQIVTDRIKLRNLKQTIERLAGI
jgi:hypothetical protein